MNESIVVIGSSNVDMVMKVNHFPKPGETVIGNEFKEYFGGKGANQAVAAAKAGGNVGFVSCLGDDVYATPMIRNFKEVDINTTYVFKENGINCGNAFIIVDSKGENIITVSSGANQRLSPDHLVTASGMISTASIILLQNEIPAETIQSAINMAVKTGTKIIYNFAPPVEQAAKYWKKIDILVLNKSEVSFVLGRDINDDIGKAAKEILRMGVKSVIITLGSDGCYVLSDEFEDKIDSIQVDVVDTTGAGDVFCGALATALAEGKLLHKAVRFANIAAGISVGRAGAQSSSPIREEINKYISNGNSK